MSPDMLEKGEANQLENGGHGSNGSSDVDIDKETNHQSYDGHTSFNKYPTHEPGYENKVGVVHTHSIASANFSSSHSASS